MGGQAGAGLVREEGEERAGEYRRFCSLAGGSSPLGVLTLSINGAGGRAGGRGVDSESEMGDRTPSTARVKGADKGKRGG